MAAETILRNRNERLERVQGTETEIAAAFTQRFANALIGENKRNFLKLLLKANLEILEAFKPLKKKIAEKKSKSTKVKTAGVSLTTAGSVTTFAGCFLAIPAGGFILAAAAGATLVGGGINLVTDICWSNFEKNKQDQIKSLLLVRTRAYQRYAGQTAALGYFVESIVQQGASEFKAVEFVVEFAKAFNFDLNVKCKVALKCMEHIIRKHGFQVLEDSIRMVTAIYTFAASRGFKIGIDTFREFEGLGEMMGAAGTCSTASGIQIIPLVGVALSVIECYMLINDWTRDTKMVQYINEYINLLEEEVVKIKLDLSSIEDGIREEIRLELRQELCTEIRDELRREMENMRLNGNN